MSRTRPRHLAANTQGTAGLEAALLLPVFVFFIVGAIELYQHFRVKSLLDRAAYSVAHSVGTQRELYRDSPDCPVANDICVYGAVAADLFRPLNFQANGRLRITTYVAQNGAWQILPNSGWPADFGNALISTGNVGNTNDLPGPVDDGESVVVVEALYQSTPFALSSRFWEQLGGQSTLYSRAAFKPRYLDLHTLISAGSPP